MVPNKRTRYFPGSRLVYLCSAIVVCWIPFVAPFSPHRLAASSLRSPLGPQCTPAEQTFAARGNVITHAGPLIADDATLLLGGKLQDHVENLCVIFHRKWDVLEVSGEDALRFMHSQATNKFEGAQAGTVFPASFVTNTGRMLDMCDAAVTGAAVKLRCSPGRGHLLVDTFRKYIFPLDKVEVRSCTEEHAVFIAAGPLAQAALQRAGAEALPTANCLESWAVGQHEVWAYAGTGLGVPGYTVMVPAAAADEVKQLLLGEEWGAAAVVAGEAEWEALRIMQGVPAVGKELTLQHNPLEAGLWHTVHFDKGCYIGQETISRVNAYDAVQTQLFGLRFPERSWVGEKSFVREGDRLTVEGGNERAGVITSVAAEGWWPGVRCLGYIRRKAGAAGLRVTTAGGVTGVVVDVPYPTRSDAQSAHPPKRKEAVGELTLTEQETPAYAQAQEAARKAAKLKAMAEKVAALQAQRKRAARSG